MNVASICVPIATQVPACGGPRVGPASSRDPTRSRSSLFGDGATSEGAFHEGANIAAVVKAPLVLLCNNNQWAISTPLSAQTAAARLSDKAIGYGMPALRVDGHDVLAVYEAVQEGVARARAGEGPTFVEAVTYRSAPHATADDPSLYIDPDRVAAERSATASRSTRRTSSGSALLDDERSAAVREEALAAMRAGIQEAEDEAPADPELVFAHAYADPPASLARDLDELRRVHAP